MKVSNNFAAFQEPLTPWPPLPRRVEGGFPSLSRSDLRVRPGHPARGKNPSPPGPLSPGGARGDFLHCPGRLCESDAGCPGQAADRAVCPGGLGNPLPGEQQRTYR